MNKRLVTTLASAAILFLSGCAGSSVITVDEMSDAEVARTAASSIEAILEGCRATDCGFEVDPGAGVDTVLVDRSAETVRIEFNDAFAEKPVRDASREELERLVGSELEPWMTSWTTEFHTRGVELQTLVPNAYSESGGREDKRWPEFQAPKPLVTDIDRPWRSATQLAGRHVALWPSHGWYYEERTDRWEWQRARLFQTVEDLFPMSFIVPYLAPMLEGAGMYTHMPRERDVQAHEVVIDNDSATLSATGSRYLEVAESDMAWETGATPGYRHLDRLLTENPFSEGSYRESRTDTEVTAQISWVPEIPETGAYAVYASWHASDDATRDARYVVHHSGGSTELSVDQTMMGGTWVYLGTWSFDQGVHPEVGRVDLINASSDPGRVLTADAVRFGGGMGHVERAGLLSGRPRFTEGARYWMQYAGFPAALVYNVTESSNDYVDDYRSRAEWVNYLRGAPFGPNKDRDAEGLGVPVDISLAFHTDAGVTKSDETIGTLMIFSSTGMEQDREFPAGFSRFANRDLGDMMQTEIVDDIRSLYDSTWTRRDLWDRDYSEAVRPNVPGVLLELLSHQNFADMRFGLDPRFKFDVSRSIYKSMARFLADQYGYDAIIQPLPPHGLRTDWVDGAISVSWEAQADPLEPTAAPRGYVVYQRRGDRGYDNGTFVVEPNFVVNEPEPGVVYGFRVTAVNAGGEGMPSETVAAGEPRGGDAGRGEALVVAAFDRVSAPGTVDLGEMRGFAGFVDEGVADGYDLAYIGEQYDFDPDSPWLDDDSPGHGASWATHETEIVTGNTFDYPMAHAAALMASGFRVSTQSDEVFNRTALSSSISFVDVILGEEKTTVGPGRKEAFEAVPTAMQDQLESALDSGIKVFMSGAHVATDMAGPEASTVGRSFATNRLGFLWRTNRAVQRGGVSTEPELTTDITAFSFETDRSGPVYRVEHPDALDPTTEGETLMRYADNNMSAAVGQPGSTIVMGFPFETIENRGDRVSLMRAIIAYLFDDSSDPR